MIEPNQASDADLPFPKFPVSPPISNSLASSEVVLGIIKMMS